nr:MAG TPA: hypothetical protein [Caudoviricetes sp.]
MARGKPAGSFGVESMEIGAVRGAAIRLKI